MTYKIEETNYIEKNKEAWEEAFDNRVDGWGETVMQNLQSKSDYYILVF